MTIAKLMENRTWDEATQTWVDTYSPTAAQLVKTSDGSNVQAKLDALPGQLTDAQATAVAEIRADVVAGGDTLAKLYGLIEGLQTLTQSDTETLDTLQEVVEFIKANRTDIDAIGTGKVNIVDIINDLTTVGTVEGKTLDARQGKVLKGLIDALTVNVTALQGQAADFVTTQQLTDGMSAATAAARTVVSDTPPANPVDGQVWLKPGGTITI